eukprot:TRINITY_DN10464_c0_g1_i3.p3 TRINITY_DN10464_c0_g1~~TRINITY_DN10464_c0_g1_i3.p3  ORF type:complete len:165 (-),score=55.12 TRINITY_DN10464_c0_g1_i3:85-579(-)
MCIRDRYMGIINVLLLSMNEAKIAEIKEAFSFFDKDGDGIVSTNNMGLLVRSLNQNPTNDEIENMIKDADPENTGKMDFPEFLRIMEKNMKDVDAEEELLDAFKIFDPGNKGFMDSAELRVIVTKMGEQFTEEEAEQMIREADPENTGRVSYDDFIQKLLTKFE